MKMNRKKYEDVQCMRTKNLPILIHDMVCLFPYFFLINFPKKKIGLLIFLLQMLDKKN